MSEHITEKDIIVDFLKSCTVEVTPGGADKIDSFPDLLRENTTVYVTFLPGSDFADTAECNEDLRLATSLLKRIPDWPCSQAPTTPPPSE